MMTTLLTQLSSPRPSSGYGSSEDEQNFLFHRHPTSGLVTPTSYLSTSSSSLWISTSGLSGRTSCLSTSTTSDDSSCPVTPDSMTSVVEFPPVFDLSDGDIGFGSHGGFFAEGVDLGELCAREELTDDLQGPLLNDLSCLGFDLEFDDTTGCPELCYNAEEYVHHDGNILAVLLKRPRGLYPHARGIKTEAPSSCASADPLIASHQMAHCSAPRGDWLLGHLASLTPANSPTDRAVTDDVAFLGNRCHRKTSSPTMVSRSSGEYAKKPSNCYQSETCVRGDVRLCGRVPVTSDVVEGPVYISTDPVESSAHHNHHQTTTARTRPYVTGSGQSSGASGSRASTGCRRNFSELDDHRYSSSPNAYGPPPTKVARLTRTSRATPPIPQATILETFLLTKEPLRANAGSDAMLAVSGVAQLRRKSSLSGIRFHEGKSVLEGLLTETNNYVRGRQPTVSEPAGVAVESNRTVVSAPGSNPNPPKAPEPRKKVEGSTVKNDISRKSSSSSSGSRLVDNNCELLSGDQPFVGWDALQLAMTSADDSVGSQGWIPSRHDDRIFSSEVEDILHQQFQSDDLLMHPFLSDLLCEPKTF